MQNSIENQFKKNITAGKKQYGIWNGIPDSYAAEICAGAGFDFIVFDAEHAPYDVGQIIHNMQAVSRYNTCSPVVRMPGADLFLLKKLLDAGIQSFIIPMIESLEQAKEMASAVKYPPSGTRGVGTALARAAQWNRVDDYFNKADDEICLILQIESLKGLEALDEILELPGVDIIFLGPADLAGSMGYLGQPGHPDVVVKIHECIDKIKHSDKAAGILTSDKKLIDQYSELGVDMLAVGLDTILLAKATKAIAEMYKPELKDLVSNTKY